MNSFLRILSAFTIMLLTAGGCTQGGSSKASTPAADSTAAAGQAWSITPATRNKLASTPYIHSLQRWQGDFGLIIETTHYRIFTTEKDPLILVTLPKFLECAHTAYQDMLGYRLKKTRISDIYHFAARKQWEDFTENYTGDMWPIYRNINRGAYYLNGICVSYNIGRNATMSALAHEGWHQFSRQNFKYALPSWLDEGLAMQFEAFTYQDGKYHFRPSRNLNRLGALKQAMNASYRGERQLFTLPQLISLNPGQIIIRKDKALTGEYYAQVYALIRFLREYDYGRYKPYLTGMLVDGMLGKWPVSSEVSTVLSKKTGSPSSSWNSQFSRELFQRYIPLPPEKLSKEYLDFCNALTFPIHLAG